MDSMVEEGHINNYFSMALCGRGSNISGLGSEEVGGSVVRKLYMFVGDKNISILHLSCRRSDLKFSLVL